MAPEPDEGLGKVDARSLGDDSLRLLDHDAALERAVQLLVHPLDLPTCIASLDDAMRRRQLPGVANMTPIDYCARRWPGGGSFGEGSFLLRLGGVGAPPTTSGHIR
jgi:hypothetical protein